MKRAFLIAFVALTLAAIATGDRWFDWLQARLGLGDEDAPYLGYVEGETTLIGPPTAGRLIARPVERGDQLKAGARLFVVDPTQAEAEVARGEAVLREAAARLANLRTGKRPEEQEIVRAQRREAEAALVYAEQDLTRETALVARGAGTQARLDHARSNLAQLRARVESLTAQLLAGDLGGRDQELAGAEAQVAQDRASLAQFRRRLEDLMPVAPRDALVENTFFNPGEYVPAGAPVVALLEPERIKLRFFVPAAHLAFATTGRDVRFTCDGCPAALAATISFVSPRAEFTPPVIYSESARSKLVFLIEARLTVPAAMLKPGLPVQVDALARQAP